LSTKWGYKCYKAKVKDRVPFRKKEELFFFMPCLWQANFFFLAKAQRSKGAKPAGRQAAKGSIFS
jgi:hypothetical protein